MVNKIDFSNREITQIKSILGIILLYIICTFVYSSLTTFTKQIEVKTHIDSISGMGQFIHGSNMISDMNDNVYVVENNLILLKFNASENLSKLEPGKMYTVNGYGERIPFLGLYPHITKVY